MDQSPRRLWAYGAVLCYRCCSNLVILTWGSQAFCRSLSCICFRSPASSWSESCIHWGPPKARPFCIALITKPSWHDIVLLDSSIAIIGTRISATADGPVAVSTAVQLYGTPNKLYKSTTNRSELEHRGRGLCSKLGARYSHGTATVVSVVNKLDRRRVLLTGLTWSTCHGKTCLGNSSRGKYPYFSRYPNFLKTQYSTGKVERSS